MCDQRAEETPRWPLNLVDEIPRIICSLCLLDYKLPDEREDRLCLADNGCLPVLPRLPRVCRLLAWGQITIFVPFSPKERAQSPAIV